jgi:hypothetical protein
MSSQERDNQAHPDAFIKKREAVELTGKNILLNNCPEVGTFTVAVERTGILCRWIRGFRIWIGQSKMVKSGKQLVQRELYL